MKKSSLSLVLAALTLSATSVFANDVATNGNPHARTVVDPARPADNSSENIKHNAKATLQRKADIDPRNAGGTEGQTDARKPTNGLDTNAAVDNRNAGGSETAATTTSDATRTVDNTMDSTNASQSSGVRNGAMASESTNTNNGPSGLTIFAIIAAIAIAAGFAFRAYRQRNVSQY